MTIEELKEIIKDATQQAFDGQRISLDEEGAMWDIIASERLWFRTLLDSVEVEPKYGKWMPVDKALPEYDTLVLVQLKKTGNMFVGMLTSHVDGTGTIWDLPAFASFLNPDDVAAWMLLPAPYKMNEVEEDG